MAAAGNPTRRLAHVDAGAVIVENDGDIATVTLCRPERMNALDGQSVILLRNRLAALAARRSLRALVLTGAGTAFCAGGDVGGLAQAGAHGPLDPRQLRGRMQISELLHTMPAVTIAAVNGACAGAGLGFAAACDLRYAAASAVFATAFLRVGMSGDHGTIWSVTRAVGPARARELFLLGDRIGADEAAACGLVHRVLPDAELRGYVAGVAQRLAAVSPSALRAMKSNLNDAIVLPFDRYLDAETQRFAEVCGSSDAQEAARAYFENATPYSTTSERPPAPTRLSFDLIPSATRAHGSPALPAAGTRGSQSQHAVRHPSPGSPSPHRSRCRHRRTRHRGS